MGEVTPLLSPRAWAKLRKVSPQLVYYYLRTNEEFQACLMPKGCEVCGHGPVLDVQHADKVWKSIHSKGGD